MLDIKQIESFYPEYIRKFKRNILREYIQYKILEIIYASEFGASLIFMGGTAAHIIHGNTRFSEDLDFDNLGLSQAEFRDLAGLIKQRLEREGYIIDTKSVFKGAYTSYLRLPRVLYDNDLAYHKEEVLLIKLDAEPQNFKYKPDKPIINKFDVFTRISVVPVDLLLSQKISAIFTRKRQMGRDFYDTIFLAAKTGPNLDYLKAKFSIEGRDELEKKLLKLCKNLDFKQLAKDVEQFLFMSSDSKKVLLFCEYINDLFKPNLNKSDL